MYLVVVNTINELRHREATGQVFGVKLQSQTERLHQHVQRDRERERERDRQTDRHRHRHRHGHRHTPRSYT